MKRTADLGGPSKRHVPLAALFIFLGLAIGIGAAGHAYYRGEKRQAFALKFEELDAVAGLKAGQIERWRRERLDDGRLIMKMRWFADQANRIQAAPADAAAVSAVMDRLEAIREAGEFDSAVLISGDGRELARSPAGSAPLKPDMLSRAREILRAGAPSLSDLHSNEELASRLVISLALPILPAEDGRPGAVLVLRIDPLIHLFPMIQAWPTPSPTAETLLVRREGGEVVFLNDLRHQKGTALALRIPMSREALPAVMAVRGRPGRMRGLDYRKTPVLAAYRPVPASPWSLVSKVDEVEVLAPVRRRARMILLVTLCFILAAGAIVALLFRRQSERSFRRELAAEQGRRAIAERFALLSRHANDVIMLVDENDRIIEANEKALATYGFPRERLIGRLTTDFRPTAERPGYQAVADRAAREGGAIFETVHLRADGTSFPVEISLRLVEAEGRRRFLAIIRDITERKKTESRNLRLNRMFRLLGEINQAIVHTPERGRLLEALCRIAVDVAGFRLAWIGWEDPLTREVRPEFVSGPASDFLREIRISDREAPSRAGPARRAIQEGRHVILNDLEADAVPSTWREKAAAFELRSFAAFPMKADGACTGVLNLFASETGFFDEEEVRLIDEVAANISFALQSLRAEEDRKRAVAEVIRLNAELEDRVRDRTARLEEANRRLLDLDRLKSMFIASMSHELRTPLNSIIGFSSILLQEWPGPLNAEPRENLDIVMRSGRHLLALINDVIDISKVEAGMIEPRVEDFDIAGVVREAVEAVANDAAGKGLAVAVNAPPTPYRGDRRRLLQCVLNLASNAVKFTEKGRIDIAVRRDETEIEISVQDTGIGIPAADLAKLFQPFTRLDSALRSRVLGTGLGLYLTKKLLTEVFRGRILAESEPGRGSRFAIRIPLVRAEGAP